MVGEGGFGFDDDEVVDDVVEFAHTDFEPVELCVDDEEIVDFSLVIAMRVDFPVLGVTYSRSIIEGKVARGMIACQIGAA